jgi:anti-anti-sigma factor
VGKLAIEPTGADDVPGLRLRGDLDMAGVVELERELERLEASRPDVVLLDLRELTFLDSSGLRSLLAADNRARRRGRRLELVRAPAGVQRVFEIALLDRRLTFVELPEAIEGAS